MCYLNPLFSAKCPDIFKRLKVHVNILGKSFCKNFFLVTWHIIEMSPYTTWVLFLFNSQNTLTPARPFNYMFFTPLYGVRIQDVPKLAPQKCPQISNKKTFSTP
jgi:hypothetical protein